jgi:hypothetical protein
MGISDGLNILQVWGPIAGPIIAALCFLFWQNWRREMCLQGRVEALERDQKDLLLPLVKECAAVIAQNTAVMTRLEKMLERQTVAETQDVRDMLDRLLEDAQQARQ